MTSLSKLSDHDLIKSFVAGNVAALETLVLRHKDKLYTSILFLVKDKYLAEDIFQDTLDRKSTRLNSSHANISYAVFCLKKKKEYSLHRACSPPSVCAISPLYACRRECQLQLADGRARCLCAPAALSSTLSCVRPAASAC